MGLDMYLYARGGVNIDTGEQLKDEEIAYWRKFNALHTLFLEVTGADLDSNCEELDLTEENLVSILNTLQQVKLILDKAPKYIEKETEDGIISQPIDVEDILVYEGDDFIFDEETNELIQELLPPQGGFFWGSTNIDSWYYEDVVRAIPDIQNALDLTRQGERIYYYCWW